MILLARGVKMENKGMQGKGERVSQIEEDRESLMETRTTLRSLSETLLTTALPSSVLHLIPSTKPLQANTWLRQILTCKFSDILLLEAYSALVFLVS